MYAVAPTSIMPRVTAGLNNPPLMRKNTQAFTMSARPNTKEIYMILLGFAARSVALAPWAGAVLTTFVPPNAKSKNMNFGARTPSQQRIFRL